MSRNIQKKENNPTFEYLIGFFASKNRFSTTTYINLQDAYVVEANAIGSWSQVGYTGAGNSSANGSATAVFYYIETAPSSNNAGTLWKAQALQKLNDCASGDKWGLYVGISGSEADGQSNAVYNAGASNSKCLDLTPSFTKLVSARNTATTPTFN